MVIVVKYVTSQVKYALSMAVICEQWFIPKVLKQAQLGEQVYPIVTIVRKEAVLAFQLV